MGKYRKKPVIIEAFRYGYEKNPAWFEEKVLSKEIVPRIDHEGKPTPEGYWCEINTLEGKMRANCGDYIIRGVKGECYPCRRDIFKETYEEVYP